MRPGMSCGECGLTDAGMHSCSANDDAAADRLTARGLLGDAAWRRYCARWDPLRWLPERLRRALGGRAA